MPCLNPPSHNFFVCDLLFVTVQLTRRSRSPPPQGTRKGYPYHGRTTRSYAPSAPAQPPQGTRKGYPYHGRPPSPNISPARTTSSMVGVPLAGTLGWGCWARGWGL